MKRFLLKSVEACCALALIFASFGANASVQAQTSETDVSQSMGVGKESRFASGAPPLEIERTDIQPGTPMSSSSTMEKLISSGRGGSASFGGILGRYTDLNFGKLFGSADGTVPSSLGGSRLNSLEALDQGDNEVQNVDAERMYPPRLVLDFNRFPTRSLRSNAARVQVASQIRNTLARFDLDPKVESVRVAFKGTTVYLRGQVRSSRCSSLIESVVGLQSGVERVVNELNVLEPDTNNVDLFGNSNL